MKQYQNLLRECFRINIGANTTTTPQYITPKARGTVKRIGLFNGANSAVDSDLCLVTILVSGTQIMNNVPLSMFLRDTENVPSILKLYEEIPEGATIDFRVVNQSANALKFDVVFEF